MNGESIGSAFQTNEGLRKFLHILFGLFAFSLKYLPWRIAALVAAAAVVTNWALLHRLVGKRVARHERGWDWGIVLYPAAVLALGAERSGPNRGRCPAA